MLRDMRGETPRPVPSGLARRRPLRHVTRVLLSLLCVWLAACAPLTPRTPDWPPGLPPRAGFAAVYAEDPANHAYQDEATYLLWVRRFYTGWAGFPQGWLDVARDVVRQLPAADQAAAATTLAALGERIAAEWAKKTPTRRIHNQTAAAWGDALALAVEREAVPAYLARVTADVDALYARRLDHVAITVERYFPDAADDPFYAP